jgi:hypothetical protein
MKSSKDFFCKQYQTCEVMECLSELTAIVNWHGHRHFGSAQQLKLPKWWRTCVMVVGGWLCEVGLLSRRCSLLLNSTSAAAVMKEPQRMCWRGPGTGAEAAVKGSWHSDGGSMRSSRFLDGGLAAAACEGNEILWSDSGWKVGPRFIMSSISSDSTWNRCWILYINSSS